MIVTVTQRDISNARRALDLHNFMRSRDCPVARAIRRATKRRNLEVGSSTVYVGGGKRARLPAKAQDFIRQFDAISGGAPFSFRMRRIP